MSRAHMLYSNDALTSLPVKITTWPKAWKPDDVFRSKRGTGLIVEGVLQGKSKHTIVDGNNNNLKFRYIVLNVKVVKAVRRKYDCNGQEIEPDFGSKKIALTGYLSSKTISKEGEDVLSVNEATKSLKIEELHTILPNEIPSDVVSVWCEEKDMQGLELVDSASVRLRTKGEGPFLDSIICVDSETKSKVNYTTGDSVGGTWTDKVLNTKDEKDAGSHLTEDSSAVDDDEWDD